MPLLNEIGATFMSVNMNKPLNIAHCREREAEQEVEKKNFDKAELKYKLAADMMHEALKEVSGSPLEAPLTIQLEKLREMQTVLDIRRKEAALAKNTDGDVLVQSEQSNETPEASAGIFDYRYKDAVNEHTSLPTTWQVVPKELIKMLNNNRETDTLLQFLNAPVEFEDLSTSRKVPKSKDEVIEQYKTRSDLLQRTAQTLMKALEDKEKENEMLKHQVSGLLIENSDLHEQLTMYERNRHFQGLPVYAEQEIDEEQKLSNSMITSMLIDQPESYFEFNANDVEAELRDAVRDITPPSTSYKSSGGKFQHKTKLEGRGSVQYEDLETEFSEATLNADIHDLGSNVMHMTSLAGLPPSSPPNLDLNANNDRLL